MNIEAEIKKVMDRSAEIERIIKDVVRSIESLSFDERMSVLASATLETVIKNYNRESDVFSSFSTLHSLLVRSFATICAMADEIEDDECDEDCDCDDKARFRQ